MPEKISTETRSRMMSGIRAKNTRPEITIRQFLHAEGFRFRLHRKDLPGHPDVVLPRWKVIVFAHGCFWHGHKGCAFFRLPKTRTEFWTEKIFTNAERDAQTIHELGRQGWRIAIVWECALRTDPNGALRRLINFITGKRRFVEIADVGGQAKASYTASAI